MSWYRFTGSVANGATAVTGVTTAFLSQVKAEDAISFDGGGKWYEVASVTDNTHLVLATAFAETTVSGGAVVVNRGGRRWSLTSDVAATLADILAKYPLPILADALKLWRVNSDGTAFELVDALSIGFEAGSASAPSLFAATDTNTGIWFPAADTIKIGTGGAQSITIAPDRSVLVGDATSPNAAFNVATSPTFGGSDWIAWFRHEGSAANNESLIRHEHFSNTQTPLPIIAGIANRGTIASRSAVQSGDYLLVLDGRGYDGSAIDWSEYAAGISDTAAQIAFRAAEHWSGSAHGAKITFSTVAIGATTATLRWTLNDTGGWSANGVTGGDKGAGTINATNLYVNNVAALTVNNLATAAAGRLGYYSDTHTVAGSANFTISGSTFTIGQAGTALGALALAGNTSGNTTLQPAAAASGTLTLPAATDTLVGRATTDTLTNKTLNSPLGSASAPAFAFGGDTNTGMYSPGADTIAWAVGGVQHLSLSASALTLPGAAGASTVIAATSPSATAFHRGDIQFFRNNAGGAIANGWWVGTFNFFGHDGTSNLGAANFACVADGAVSTGVVPLGILFQTGTNSSPTTRLRISSAGNVVIGAAALATNATDGFVYLPSSVGAPTGAPTSYAGTVPVEIDTTNLRLYANIGGTWRYATLT